MSLKHPVFVIGLIIYLVLRMGAEFGCQPPLFHGHITDLLCMPLVLTMGQGAVQLAFTWFRVNAVLAWVTCAAFAVWFEVVLPTLDPRHTADFWDVVCYAGGTAIFLRFNGRLSAQQFI